MVLRAGVAVGSDPMVMGSASEAVLGYSFTDARWAPNVDLNALSPEATGCFWNNPSLYVTGGRLYVIPECQMYSTGSVPDFVHSKIEIFSTIPSGAPSGWAWSYVGSFADQSVARELGAATLRQPDIITGRDGKLIGVFARLDDAGSSLGCVALSMTSIDPPVFERDCAGNLKVLGWIQSSSNNDASCTYDVASDAGMIVNRVIGNYSYSLMTTPLRP